VVRLAKSVSAESSVELPFSFGSEAWQKRLKEAIEKEEKPVEVNCFGGKFEIKHGIIIRHFNEKAGIWMEEPGVEYKDICPACGKLMLVRAITRTTWLACCSKECYEKYLKHKEMESSRIDAFRKMISEGKT
jgi:hypothetical protein